MSTSQPDEEPKSSYYYKSKLPRFRHRVEYNNLDLNAPPQFDRLPGVTSKQLTTEPCYDRHTNFGKLMQYDNSGLLPTLHTHKNLHVKFDPVPSEIKPPINDRTQPKRTTVIHYAPAKRKSSSVNNNFSAHKKPTCVTDDCTPAKRMFGVYDYHARYKRMPSKSDDLLAPKRVTSVGDDLSVLKSNSSVDDLAQPNKKSSMDYDLLGVKSSSSVVDFSAHKKMPSINYDVAKRTSSVSNDLSVPKKTDVTNVCKPTKGKKSVVDHTVSKKTASAVIFSVPKRTPLINDCKPAKTKSLEVDVMASKTTASAVVLSVHKRTPTVKDNLVPPNTSSPVVELLTPTITSSVVILSVSNRTPIVNYDLATPKGTSSLTDDHNVTKRISSTNDLAPLKRMHPVEDLSTLKSTQCFDKHAPSLHTSQALPKKIEYFGNYFPVNCAPTNLRPSLEIQEQPLLHTNQAQRLNNGHMTPDKMETFKKYVRADLTTHVEGWAANKVQAMGNKCETTRQDILSREYSSGYVKGARSEVRCAEIRTNLADIRLAHTQKAISSVEKLREESKLPF